MILPLRTGRGRHRHPNSYLEGKILGMRDFSATEQACSVNLWNSLPSSTSVSSSVTWDCRSKCSKAPTLVVCSPSHLKCSIANEKVLLRMVTAVLIFRVQNMGEFSWAPQKPPIKDESLWPTPCLYKQLRQWRWQLLRVSTATAADPHPTRVGA